MVVRGLVRRVVRGVVRRVVRGVGSVGSPRSGGQFFQLSHLDISFHLNRLCSDAQTTDTPSLVYELVLELLLK